MNEITTDIQRGGEAFILSPAEVEEVAARYPAKAQKNFWHWMALVEEVYLSSNQAAAARAIAARLRHVKGMSEKTITRKFYLFKNKGWRGLMDLKRAGAAHWTTLKPVAMPEAFKEFAKGVFEENGRALKPAWEEMCDIWRTRVDRQGNYFAAIPGYTSWPLPDPQTGLPSGWTYANLSRVCKLSAVEKAASRLGRHAAKAFAMPVLKTRVGVPVGRLFEFDDHDFNHYVLHALCPRPMRPMCFGAVDYTTNARVLLGCKPAMWDDDAQKKKVLTEFDFAWFVVHHLCTIGFRTDEIGTIFMVENAKAAIRGDKTREIEDKSRTDFEAMIYRATGGKVRVMRGGIDRQPALLGQMEGEAKGNFRAKSLVEGDWYPLDTRLASLPGHVGKDYEHKREDTDAILRLNAQLVKATGGDMERYAALDGRLLWYDEFAAAVSEANERILDATDHAMKGWEKCGFMTVDPATGSPRRMSRREAWRARAHELTRLSPTLIPMMLGAKYGRPVVVKANNIIEFDDRTRDTDSIRFVAATNDGAVLKAGSYWGFFNPFNERGAMIVCDGPETLRIVGVCPRYIEPAADKIVEIRKLMGESRKLLTNRLARMNLRHTGAALDLAVTHAHNAAVLAAQGPRRPVTSIRQTIRKEKNEQARLATIAEDAIAAAAPA